MTTTPRTRKPRQPKLAQSTTPRLIDQYLTANHTPDPHPPVPVSALGAMWDQPTTPAPVGKTYSTFRDLAQDVLAALQSQGTVVIGQNVVAGPEGQTVLCQQRIKLLRERCDTVMRERARLADTYQRVCSQIEQSLQGGEIL